MADIRVERLARTLVQYSVAVKPGETVALMGEISALPLLRATYNEVIKAGGNCVTHLTDDQMSDFFLRNASDAQLEWLSPLETWLSTEAPVRIFIRSSTNTRRSSRVDPKRNAIHDKARNGLSKARMERSATGAMRWTLTQFPTDAYAQEADMSLAELEDFVYGATFADQPDPVACWEALYKNQQKYVDWLKGKKHIRVQGPNVDMSLSVEGRPFINSGGTHNMPSGEIFTGPVENSVNGWVRFTYPGIREGRQVEGVELKFQDGKVVGATARKNQDFLTAMLDTDAGSRYLGEWAIGTNFGINRFTGNILFDEKIGGTIHMALGRGYPETGSKNESAIHWDLICDMRIDSEIVVDGELFYKNGQFVV